MLQYKINERGCNKRLRRVIKGGREEVPANNSWRSDLCAVCVSVCVYVCV